MSSAVLRIRRTFDVGLAATFVVGVCLPGMGMMLDRSSSFDVEMEKRPPASLPILEYRRWAGISVPRRISLLAFPGQFEAYFNDALGFRRAMLDCFATARIGGVVPAAAADHCGGAKDRGGRVLLGRRGWLYLGGDDCVDLARSARPFSSDELRDWVRAFDERGRWLDERNIRFVLMIAPNKSTIYPEHLPESLNRVGNDSRLDALSSALGSAGNLQVVDLRASLTDAKSSRQVFYQADSHWNAHGGWIAYETLLGRLRTMFPKLQPRTADEYEFLAVAGHSGDLAKMLHAASWIESGHVVVRPRSGSEIGLTRHTVDAGDGRYAVIHTARNPAGEEDSALVIHDSFFFCMQPSVNEHWRQTTYADRYFDDFPAALIDRVRPQVVVFECTEETLMKPPPINGPWSTPPVSDDLLTAESPTRTLR